MKLEVIMSNNIFLDCYNPRNDPDVKQNKKREDDVLSEFLDTFEENHKLFVN